MIIRLNDVPIKVPTSFDIEKFNITKSGRIASGKMVMDLVAKKRKFYFGYDVISGADKKVITDIVDGDAVFFTLTYEEDNEVKTATVYGGSLKATKFRTDGGWYWKNFTFDLIEQ